MPVRKIPKNYRNLTGVIKNTKANRMSGFESTLERDFYFLLDFHDHDFEEQPVLIEFDHEGSRRKYTPDVLVTFKSSPMGVVDRKPELYEIKYREDLRKEWPACKPRFKAARRYARKRDWKFKIITEKEIRGPQLETAQFLRGFKKKPADQKSIKKLLSAIAILGDTNPDSLLSYITTDAWERAELVKIIWHLVATKRIKCDLSKMLTMKCTLSPVSVWSVK